MKIKITWDVISLYDVECLLRLFLPSQQIKNSSSNEYVIIENLDSKIKLEFLINNTLFSKEVIPNFSEAGCEYLVFIEIYNFLKKITGITPPWGTLTGIRPIKLLRTFVQDLGREQAWEYFSKKFLVAENKISLAFNTMNFEEPILSLSDEKSVSLYIAIPFCPTKCHYCSFVSSSVEKSMHLVQKYVDLLCLELRHTAALIKQLGLRLETVYVGGGTPTTLNESQLEQLLSVLSENFDMINAREITVEAGRPDTITAEKLKVLKNFGVTRISINPQTLNDKILETIGRKHNTNQTIDAFNLARTFKFNQINMDLIAGLPGDTLESFQKSLSGILKLDPENITVHTLCIKRASDFNKQHTQELLSESEKVYQMLDFSQKVLTNQSYHPYYLYRQSNMIGNLENVGWTKNFQDCLYNVYIMDEVHTILACGAGAVTKIKDPHSNRIERIFNFKYPYEYISRFDEILTRKEKVRLFYDEL